MQQITHSLFVIFSFPDGGFFEINMIGQCIWLLSKFTYLDFDLIFFPYNIVFNLDFEKLSIWKSGTNTQLNISLFHPLIEYLYLDMTLYACEKYGSIFNNQINNNK